MEKIFLETSVQLVSEGSSELSDRQAEALEKLTFDWVLNAEKYVDARFSELYKAREKAGPCFLLPSALPLHSSTLSATFKGGHMLG